MTSTDTKAIVHFAGNDFFVGVTPSGHAQAIKTDSERASAATPMELLLIALGSCTAVDVISILKKKRQQITDYRVEVSGVRREEHPHSYTRLDVKHIVRGRAVSAQAARATAPIARRRANRLLNSLPPSTPAAPAFTCSTARSPKRASTGKR